jgi:hypothetical protein
MGRPGTRFVVSQQSALHVIVDDEGEEIDPAACDDDDDDGDGDEEGKTQRRIDRNTAGSFKSSFSSAASRSKKVAIAASTEASKFEKKGESCGARVLLSFRSLL